MTDLEILEGLGEIIEEIAGVPAAEVNKMVFETASKLYQLG